MAYLGNAPARSFISFERQVFTIVNSQTAYTLSHSVNNENDIRLVINNVVQEPGSGKAYTASGTTLTLSAALVNGTDEMYCVFLGRAVATNKPGAGSVGASQLASDAVTAAKLNDDIISGQTELAAEPADTDEFLVSDAGTLKRIDYSYIKDSGGITMADQWRLSSNYTYPSSGATQLTANWERIDTDSPGLIGSGMTESSGIFTFPSTGIYLVHFFTNVVSSAAGNYIGFYTDLSTNGGVSFDYLNGNWDSADTNARSMAVSAQSLVDVTSTSNIKVRFTTSATGSGHTYSGNTGVTYTGATFIRLGDT